MYKILFEILKKTKKGCLFSIITKDSSHSIAFVNLQNCKISAMPPKKNQVTKKTKTNELTVDKEKTTNKAKGENKEVDAVHQDNEEKVIKSEKGKLKRKVVQDVDQNEPIQKRGRTRGATKLEEIEKSEVVNEKITVRKRTAKATVPEIEPVKISQKKKPEKKSKAEEDKEIEEDAPKKNVKQNEKKKVEKKTTDNPVETANTTKTFWNELDFECVRKSQDGKKANFRITSWNVDGLRAWIKKDALNIVRHASPDIFCLQEIKCETDQIPAEISDLQGYEKFWCSSQKKGYAGVGLLTKKKPLNIIYGIGNEDHDEDGRCITAEFDKFFLVTVYVPNAGRKLVTLDKRLEWNNIFKAFIKDLDKKKPVILCGDMNVAHSEIDLTNPKTNTKNAGFTKEERDGMTDFLNEGFIDTFRALYPDKRDSFTFWSYLNSARKKNIGWRLDYFIVSKRFQDKICDNIIHDKVFGSDHCPLTLYLHV